MVNTWYEKRAFRVLFLSAGLIYLSKPKGCISTVNLIYLIKIGASSIQREQRPRQRHTRHEDFLFDRKREWTKSYKKGSENTELMETDKQDIKKKTSAHLHHVFIGQFRMSNSKKIILIYLRFLWATEL